jgi:hypothetical protein
VGKGRSLDDLNRYLTEQGIRAANVINTQVQTRGRDSLSYYLTYDDNTAPFILTTFPGIGSTNVGLATTIVAVFSEAIQAPSSADIEIYDVTSAAIISTSLYTIDTTLVGQTQGIVRILDTGNYLVAGRVYRVTFQSTIRDVAGNTMLEDYLLTFSTGVTQAGGGGTGVGQYETIPAGDRTIILTTLQSYTTKPAITVSVERRGTYASLIDSSFSQNGNGTWNFTVWISAVSTTTTTTIHAIEAEAV